MDYPPHPCNVSTNFNFNMVGVVKPSIPGEWKAKVKAGKAKLRTGQ